MGVSPEYFLDRMSFDEINSLLKVKDFERRESWEQIRQQCFYSFKPWSEIKSPTDLFKFPWEKKKEVKPLSKDQVKKKVKDAKKWLGKGKRT